MRRMLVVGALVAALALPAHAQDSPEHLAEQALALFDPSAAKGERALAEIIKSRRADAVPILILALRTAPDAMARKIVAGLETLTGVKAAAGKQRDAWEFWMLWQEAHPETGVMPAFAKIQARLFADIDPNFKVFLDGEKKHEIRLEEITWGGVPKDGIPALTNPRLIPAAAATYLNPTDLVFGVAINGDIRAYPLRIMDWHEMFNDVIGGVPVSLAYCTLCGSGILFETTVAGQAKPLVFGSSGFLYRSNKLMYDTATLSLWNQFTGRPVVGPLTGSGIVLQTRPVAITTWSDWRTRNPATTVLALATGHRRDYRSGAAYGSYFASPKLMFPTNVDQTKLKQKDFVFALRSSGAEKAWPLALFAGGAVLNDRAGVLDLVLIGDAATRTVRAYRSNGQPFVKGADALHVVQGDEVWTVTEDALTATDGRTLARLPGHVAYWFAWSGYLGGQGELAVSQPAKP